GFLLGLLLGFNGSLESLGQLDVAQQNVLDSQAALVQGGCQLVADLLGDHFALAGIEGVGGMGSSRLANGCPQSGLDNYSFIVSPDLLKHIGGLVGVQMVNE